MKGIMRKALSLVMMLAMVATILVVPNVDAKAAEYYVTGDFANLEGCDLLGWTLSDPNGKMTLLDNGLYYKKLTYSQITVDDYKVSFKITDGSWNDTICKNNIEVRLPKGTTSIDIYFNPTTYAVTFNTEPTIVHVEKNSWDKMALYYWGTNYGTWPGVELTDAMLSDGWYTYTSDVIFDTVIITNGESSNTVQTVDAFITSMKEVWISVGEKSGDKYSVIVSTTDPNALKASTVIEAIDAIGTVELSDECKTKIQNAKDLYASYKGAASDITNADKLTAAETEWTRLMTTAAAGKVTVHVKVTDWKTCYVYGWANNASNSDVTEKWPGTAMAASENNAGWYNATFNITEAINVLFTVGKEGPQTSDWKYFTAGEYWVTLGAKGSDGKYAYTSSKEAPTGWVDEESKEIEIKPSTPDTTDKTDTTTPSTTGKYQQKYQSAIVAGDFSKLKNCNISSAWDTQTTANNMQYLGNGVYKFVLTFDKTTEEVTVEYKVAFNNSWDVSIGAKSTNTNGTTENGKNYTITIPAGTSSVTIVASEKDTAVYDSITNAAKVAEYEVIANKGETTPFALYIALMVVGCGLVVVASKKRFAR